MSTDLANPTPPSRSAWAYAKSCIKDSWKTASGRTSGGLSVALTLLCAMYSLLTSGDSRAAIRMNAVTVLIVVVGFLVYFLISFVIGAHAKQLAIEKERDDTRGEMESENKRICEQLNQRVSLFGTTDCPHCGTRFSLDAVLPQTHKVLCPTTPATSSEYDWDRKDHRVVPVVQPLISRAERYRSLLALLEAELEPILKNEHNELSLLFDDDEGERVKDLEERFFRAWGPVKDELERDPVCAQFRQQIATGNWYVLVQNIRYTTSILLRDVKTIVKMRMAEHGESTDHANNNHSEKRHEDLQSETGR